MLKTLRHSFNKLKREYTLFKLRRKRKKGFKTLRKTTNKLSKSEREPINKLINQVEKGEVDIDKVDT